MMAELIRASMDMPCVSILESNPLIFIAPVKVIHQKEIVLVLVEQTEQNHRNKLPCTSALIQKQ